MEIYYTVLQSFWSSLLVKIATQEVIFTPYEANVAYDDFDPYEDREEEPIGFYLTREDAQEGMRRFAVARREKWLRPYKSRSARERALLESRRFYRRFGRPPILRLKTMSGKDLVAWLAKYSPPRW